MVFKQTEPTTSFSCVFFLLSLFNSQKLRPKMISRFETRITYVRTLLSGRNNGD